MRRRTVSCYRGGRAAQQHVMFHKRMLRNFILILGLLGAPLALAAEPDSTFVALFGKINEAVKNRDTAKYLSFLTTAQKSLLKECLDHPACREHAQKSLDSSALDSYTIQGVEEFCGCEWVAHKVHYRGREITGTEVEGYVTFIEDDGVWKADTFSRWQTK